MIEWPRHISSRIIKEPDIEKRRKILEGVEDKLLRDLVRKHVVNAFALKKQKGKR